MSVSLLEVECEQPKVDVESTELMKDGWMSGCVCLLIVSGAEVGDGVVRIWRSVFSCDVEEI